MKLLPALLLLALSGCASTEGHHGKVISSDITPRVGRRPSFEVSPHPRMAFGPLRALFLAQLKGEPSEELYCPRIVWDFGDGDRAVRESDCAPWGKDAAFERRFSITHCYKTAGDIPVTVSLWHANRKLAQAVTTITILWRAGGGLC